MNLSQYAAISKTLASITKLIIQQGARLMSVISDLQAAVATIAADVTADASAIQAAIAKLQTAAGNSDDPDVIAATSALVAAHAGFAANVAALNAAATAVATAPAPAAAPSA